MTFFTKVDSSTLQPGETQPFGLTQRGRSGLEMLGTLQRFAGEAYRPKALQIFRSDPDGAELTRTQSKDHPADEMRRRVKRATAVVERDPVYRLERFFQRYVGEENYARGISAVEERRQVFEAFLARPVDHSGGVLELDDTLVPPRYYSEVEWHLEPGGWDGYDLYGPMFGFALGPLVFRHGGYAAVPVGADIIEHRLMAIRELPKAHYQRVFEPGCGGISTLSAFNKVHPETELHGCDLSPLLLKNGYKLAQRQGLTVHLKQADAVQTGEPDAHYDAVVTYALQHELPPKANLAMFKEMFRILKPGGDILLGDPPPFRVVDPFHAAVLAWEDDNRAEPFFSAACLADWEQTLRDVGFTDVKAYALGDDCYPWITRATKPL
jgi:SAM-dependent methyltransferase